MLHLSRHLLDILSGQCYICPDTCWTFCLDNVTFVQTPAGHFVWTMLHLSRHLLDILSGQCYICPDTCWTFCLEMLHLSRHLLDILSGQCYICPDTCWTFCLDNVTFVQTPAGHFVWTISHLTKHPHILIRLANFNKLIISNQCIVMLSRTPF